MKFLIIGHELHSHTHSYIFNGIYRALKYMKYEVDWIYNDEQINKIKSEEIKYNLIITELYYNKNIPIIKDCIYIIQQPFLEQFYNVKLKLKKYYPKSKHIWNVENFPYYITDNYMDQILKDISTNNIILWRPYLVNNNNYNCKFNYDKYKVISTPWATDLLPEEINKNIENLKDIKSKNISNFIGMHLEHNDILKENLKKYNINYVNYGGTFNKDSNKNKSIEDNIKLIQESIIAPALQSNWQIENEYIPCRIFKNISYGKMGITNNKAVNKLFDNKLIYSKDIGELVKKGLEFEKKEDKFDKIKELMIEVRDNHTYINRINFILDLLKNK